jgi:hypothetical protein
MICHSNIYVLLHQASKWGMPGLQGSFPWFRKSLPSESAKREKVICANVVNHNFHRDKVGSNQIISIAGHDKIYHYYFQPDDYISNSCDDN